MAFIRHESKTDGVQEVVYNDAIVKSDFAVFIINKQFGEKTIEEFHLVIERLKRRCLKPKICVYIKNNDYVNTNKIWFNDYSKYLTYLVFDNTIEIYEDIRKKIDQIIKRDMIIAIKSHNHYSSLRLQKLSTLFPNIYAEILTEQKTHKAFELIKIEELRHLNVDSLKSSPKLKISRTNKGIR